MVRKIYLLVVLVLCAITGMRAQEELSRINLEGLWQFKLDPDGVGVAENYAEKSFTEQIILPGTTDTNKKGNPIIKKDETTNLSRLFSYVGKAWYKKTVEIPQKWKGKYIRLMLERTKPTYVWIDGVEVGRSDNISTCQIYDLSNQLVPGKHEITIMIDNGKSVPPQLIGYSHAFTESTQTNWNGIIGNMYLEVKNRLHIKEVQVYPDVYKKSVRVRVNIASPEKIKKTTKLILYAETWNTKIRYKTKAKSYGLTKMQEEYEFDYDLGSDALLWSEFHPVLYKLHVQIGDIDEQIVNFGLREFKTSGTQFAINGHKTFLRGKHDACVFPLTGHTAMDVETWQHYFQVAKSYGINHYRFHSWCPPEACFLAADMEGIYIQAELPFWGAFDKNDKYLNSFLTKEGINIQNEYGNHASFVMFALGNELGGDLDVMKDLINTFRNTDDRRLYAFGSNNYLGFKGYLPGEDFLVTCRIGGEQSGTFNTHVRASFSFADAYDGGYINHTYPNTTMDFSSGIAGCKIPVISFETGQYQIYPNYKEIEKYKGVLYPYNMEVFKNRLAKAGMLKQADNFFRASGKWAVELYKAEIEMDLRTNGFGGFHLLDLQDYPGQGSAYVGILDAFMDSKGLVTPEKWRGFCCETVPLLVIDKFCWSSDEQISAIIKIANYAEESLNGKSVIWELKSLQGRILDKGSLEISSEDVGLIEIGRIHPNISEVDKAQRLDLEINIVGTSYQNTYGLWIYPSNNLISQFTDVIITDTLGKKVIEELKNGGKVLWFPKHKLYEKQTISGLFQTDYWNYRMFKTISENNKRPVSPGTLGILVNPEHPLFYDFPTDFHTNWQWFSIIKQSYPMILDNFPSQYTPIIQVIDNIERNHKLGLLFELAVDKGKLLICMADLEAVMDKPEVRQFYTSVLQYMHSDSFNPEFQFDVDTLTNLLRSETKAGQIEILENRSYK